MLQEIMGHASTTTTLDLYGHLYPGDVLCRVMRDTRPPTDLRQSKRSTRQIRAFAGRTAVHTYADLLAIDGVAGRMGRRSLATTFDCGSVALIIVWTADETSSM